MQARHHYRPCIQQLLSVGREGLSFLLVPLDQPGVEIRPIRQVTGTSEFNEVFFDGALARGVDVVGGVNNGWRTAMGTLAFERGIEQPIKGLRGQQPGFARGLHGGIG